MAGPKDNPPTTHGTVTNLADEGARRKRLQQERQRAERSGAESGNPPTENPVAYVADQTERRKDLQKERQRQERLSTEWAGVVTYAMEFDNKGLMVGIDLGIGTIAEDYFVPAEVRARSAFNQVAPQQGDYMVFTLIDPLEPVEKAQAYNIITPGATIARVVRVERAPKP